MADIYLAILVAYLAAIGASMAWSLRQGHGHTFGWWDGGNLLRGRTLSRGTTTAWLVVVMTLVVAGLYFILRPE